MKSQSQSIHPQALALPSYQSTTALTHTSLQSNHEIASLTACFGPRHNDERARCRRPIHTRDTTSSCCLTADRSTEDSAGVTSRASLDGFQATTHRTSRMGCQIEGFTTRHPGFGEGL